MISALVLVMIGTIDAIRSVSQPRRTAILAAVAVVVLSALAIIGLGLSVLAAAGAAVVTLAWTVAMPIVNPSRTPRCWPAVGLLGIVVVTAAYDDSGSSAHGFLVDAYGGVQLQALASVSLTTVLAAVGALVFLTRSGNIVARAALGRSQRAPSPEPELRGGRLIGPLERILILVLGLSGSLTIIAALLAAKGIVRFPEISEDRGTGSKAEEFLVGSLTSWALAGAAVLYVSVV